MDSLETLQDIARITGYDVVKTVSPIGAETIVLKDKLGRVVKSYPVQGEIDSFETTRSDVVSTPMSMEEMENTVVSTLVAATESQGSLSSSSERDTLDEGEIDNTNPLSVLDRVKARKRRGRVDGRRINPKKRKKLRRKEVDKTRAIEF